MKKVMLFALGVAALGACTNPPAEEMAGYRIDGTIAGADSMMIRQMGMVAGQYEVIDSTYSDADGHFTLSGENEGGQLYYLRIGEGRTIVDLFIGGDQVTVTGSMDSIDAVSVTGSSVYDTYAEFTNAMTEFDEKNRAFLVGQPL